MSRTSRISINCGGETHEIHINRNKCINATALCRVMKKRLSDCLRKREMKIARNRYEQIAEVDLEKIMYPREANCREDRNLIDGRYLPLELAIILANIYNKSIGEQIENFCIRKYPSLEFILRNEDNSEESDSENELSEDESSEDVDNIDDSKQELDELDEPDNSELSIIPEYGFLELNETKIICRASDRMVNLTLMCRAGNKLVADWSRNQETKDYIEALKSEMELSISELIQSNKSGIYSNRGTWAHPLVAINCAQWINPRFAVKVSRWILELGLTGSVILGKEKTLGELDSLWKAKFLDEEKQRLILQDQNEELKKELLIIKNPEFSRELGKYPEEPGIYLVEDPCDVLHRLKYGMTKSLKGRICEYYKMFKLVGPTVHYSYITNTEEEAAQIEKMLHSMFTKHREPTRSEWLEPGSISAEDAKCLIEEAVKLYEKSTGSYKAKDSQ